MEQFAALGLPVPPKQTKAHNLLLIGLVAIQNEENKKWCATHETRGWYMPAGRVDFGEGIATGAKREALEEAGVHVDLKHIIRIDFSPKERYSRFRAIYQATLTDPKQPLRDSSTADDEIIEACWVNPTELEDGRKVRTLEMVEIFEFIERTKGSPRVPADFIQSIDGYPIDHKQVVSPTLFSVTLMIFTSDHTKIAVKSKASSEITFISDFMEKPTKFVAFAESNEVLQASKDPEILGLVKLRYSPPHEEIECRTFGHMNVVIAAQVRSFPKDTPTISIKDVFDKKVLLSPTNLKLLEQVVHNQEIYHPSLIELEGTPFTVPPRGTPVTQHEKCLVS